ncbi:hypothetical protein [Aeromicrobium sp.]|uniref:hypothetical protein n=1 Tax=Aeromicrobium sp. TaxID=1871063 RepID=UPI002FC97F37
MRSRLLLVAIGLIAGIALTSAAVWANGFRTHLDTQTGTSSTRFQKVVSGATYTADVGSLCIEGNTDATITGVRIGRTYGSIRIVDFDLGPADTSPQELAKGTLDSFLVDEHKINSNLGRNLRTRCAPSQWDVRFLAVEMRVDKKAKPSDFPMAAEHFIVDYKIRGMSKSITLPSSVMFCRGDETAQEDEETFGSEPSSPLGCAGWD